jgi:hypothetical protein
MATKLDDVWKDLKGHKTRLNSYEAKVNEKITSTVLKRSRRHSFQHLEALVVGSIMLN